MLWFGLGIFVAVLCMALLSEVIAVGGLRSDADNADWNLSKDDKYDLKKNKM